MSRDVRVICHADLAPGMRLTGLPTLTAESPEAARACLDALRSDGEAGLVLVQDSLLPPGSDDGGLPVVVTFPGPRWEEAAPDERVLELLRRAIGYRVRL